MKQEHILIAGALPYANGSLHIGHLGALLPGDILARYFRAKGNPVCYISGSDCYGTPIIIRAKQENTTPEEISAGYHQEFQDTFIKLGFQFDYYISTSAPEHTHFAREFHRQLYKSQYIFEKTAPQAYCQSCEKSLTDRLVVGGCPVCSEKTRGEQCDTCGFVPEAEQLISPVCGECGKPVSFIQSRHLYLALSQLKEQLELLVAHGTGWRKNAVSFTNKYIREGLRDRAITRDIEWGVEVPKEGYEEKRIYIWAENVLAYLSASLQAVSGDRERFLKLWGANTKHYYIHGKDNIPFHSIILPALLLAQGEGFHLPDHIISSEHVTLCGRRISTSQNWAIWLKDVIEQYDPDSLRYFFAVNGPEKRDTDFSWKEFIERNNNELLGAYGNFVNRTLVFIKKYFDGVVPAGRIEPEIQQKIQETYLQAGGKLEQGSCKEALESIFELVRYGNKYYDKERPWNTRTEQIESCKNTLFHCVQIAANLAILLQPFLPFSSQRVFQWLQLEDTWEVQRVETGYVLPEITVLFKRLDPSVAAEEERKLFGEELVL